MSTQFRALVTAFGASVSLFASVREGLQPEYSPIVMATYISGTLFFILLTIIVITIRR